MAIIRKCKLSWAASDADNVIGYKLYWASGTTVDYDSNCLGVGKVTEVMIPDRVCLSNGPVMFGVTAVNQDGNESDMTIIKEPFHLHVPESPQQLSLESGDEFIVTELPEEKVIEPEVIQRLIARLEEDDASVLVDDRDLISRQEADGQPARFDIGSLF